MQETTKLFKQALLKFEQEVRKVKIKTNGKPEDTVVTDEDGMRIDFIQNININIDSYKPTAEATFKFCSDLHEAHFLNGTY